MCLLILVVGIMGTSLTHLDGHIMTFWILSTDLTFTIMFLQLPLLQGCQQLQSHRGLRRHSGDEGPVWRAGLQSSRRPTFPRLHFGGRRLRSLLALQVCLHAVFSGLHPDVFLPSFSAL